MKKPSHYLSLQATKWQVLPSEDSLPALLQGTKGMFLPRLERSSLRLQKAGLLMSTVKST